MRDMAYKFFASPNFKTDYSGTNWKIEKASSSFLRPIYTVRYLLRIVACDFCSARCSRHGKIVYDLHDIKLPVATIVKTQNELVLMETALSICLILTNEGNNFI